MPPRAFPGEGARPGPDLVGPSQAIERGRKVDRPRGENSVRAVFVRSRVGIASVFGEEKGGASAGKEMRDLTGRVKNINNYTLYE